MHGCRADARRAYDGLSTTSGATASRRGGSVSMLIPGTSVRRMRSELTLPSPRGPARRTAGAASPSRTGRRCWIPRFQPPTRPSCASRPPFQTDPLAAPRSRTILLRLHSACQEGCRDAMTAACRRLASGWGIGVLVRPRCVTSVAGASRCSSSGGYRAESSRPVRLEQGSTSRVDRRES